MKFKKSFAQAEEITFTDVKEADWFYPSVHKLVKFNIISGYEDNSFQPKQNITRAQAASIIARALQVDLKNITDPGFSDVSESYTHYKSIAKLTELGVFTKGEKFNPNENLTRAQMAKILVIAFNLNAPQLKSFEDVPVDDWSYSFVGTLGALNITTNEGQFNPKDPVGRANLAAFIERIINLKRSDSTPDIWDEWKGWGDETSC